MKILIIPSWYQTKTNPILGSFFREQALMLRNMGHEVSVIKVDLHSLKEKIDEKIEIYDDEGILTIKKHIKSFGVAKNSLIYCELIKRVYSNIYELLIEKWGVPDIIQAHSYLPAGRVGCYLGRKFNIPVVVTEHISKVHNKQLNRFDMKVLRKTVLDCDNFVCVSNSLKNVVEELTGREDIKVIPNNLSPIFGYQGIKDISKFSFVCVGNLIDSKRQGLLIDCFAEAFPAGDEELFIVGRGANYDRISRQIVELGMDRRIHLTGVLKREEVASLLNKSQVFSLLSLSETFGVSYIEALACGCPVIATQNGGAEEIVNSDNGIIVPIDDKNATIKALITVKEQYNKYNLTEISSNCISLFNETVIAKQTIELYEAVLRKHKMEDEA